MAKLFASIQRFKPAKIKMRKNTLYISDSEAKRIGTLVSSVENAVGEIDGWYPSVEQAKTLCENVAENYAFIRWIVESDPEFSEQNPEACKILIEALKQVHIKEDKEQKK